ncbi:MAG: glycine zipper 2TM domain-containing protein [Tahibacter sp.]
MHVRKALISTLFFAVSATALSSAPAQARQRDYCQNCGVITDVSREGRGEDRHLGGGTVLGAIVGGALGNQVGKGDGRKAATIAGVVAGGAVGHNVEKNRRNSRSYWTVEVQMDNGGSRTVSLGSNRDGLRRGDRVQVRGGQIYLLR